MPFHLAFLFAIFRWHLHLNLKCMWMKKEEKWKKILFKLAYSYVLDGDWREGEHIYLLTSYLLKLKEKTKRGIYEV